MHPKAFEGMKRVWKGIQIEHPETSDMVQEGIDKIEDYRDHEDMSQVLCTCMCIVLIFLINKSTVIV